MEIQLFADTVHLGSIEARIIDASMGVFGGTLQASNAYLRCYQEFFWMHTQQADWAKLKAFNLRATSKLTGEIQAEGGICITDVEGFEIDAEVCGVDYRVLRKLFPES